jgi:acetyl-CoA acetyltransferase
MSACQHSSTPAETSNEFVSFREAILHKIKYHVSKGAGSSGEAVIAGAGETPYAHRPPARATTASLLAGAARRALRNAAIGHRDVDGLAVASFSLAPDHAVDLAWKLGMRLSWLMDDTNGGASGLNMLQHARRAVEVGDASAVLVLAGDLFDRGVFRRLVDGYNAATRDYLAPLPHGGPNAIFALVTARQMAETGLERRDYGRLVVAQRAWASRNPGAVFREPLTLKEYLAAEPVADPLCVYDCAPVVAGADAVVVTRRSRARRPVRIRALRALYNADDQQGSGLRTGIAEIAPSLWAEAGVGPRDTDVLSVYDDYPAMALAQLADLGIGRDDDLRGLVDEISRGAVAVNTSGGQLSAGQAGAAGGLHGLVEAVRQLRGEARGRQLDDARIAVVTSYGMLLYRYGASAGACVLERVR